MENPVSQKTEIDLLFDGGAEFIPPEILAAVKTTILANTTNYNLSHDTLKDVIQTCLMKIWAHGDKFESGNLAYYGRLAKNTVIDFCRERKKLSRFAESPEEKDLGPRDISIMNDALLQMYSKSELDEMIHTMLDDEEAAVIILSFFEGFGLDRIAAFLDIGASTVRRRRRDAIVKLRRCLRPAALAKRKA